jgi:hypothetical protein
MCGLCGAFGNADHWSNGSGIAPDAIPAVERGLQAAAANDVLSLYGLKLRVWSERFTLSGHTGKTVMIDNLGMLWSEAEKLTGKPLDPLDENLLTHLEARQR